MGRRKRRLVIDSSDTRQACRSLRECKKGNMGAPRSQRGFDSYFTEVSFTKRVFYIVVLLFVMGVVLVSFFEPFLTPESCLEHINTGKEFGNSLFKYNPCRYKQKQYLFFLTPDECSFSRRLVISVLLGGIIGWERRQADRPGTADLGDLGGRIDVAAFPFPFLTFMCYS